jgi:hypothetical protein
MRAKVLTTDTQVSTAKINVWGIIVFPAAGTSGTVVLYNEADATKTAAKKVAALRVPYAATETSSKEVMFTRPLVCDKGLYVDMEGTNAVVYIYVD